MDEKRDVEFLPLPEGAMIEVDWRADPPLVGITVHLGGGRALTFAYTAQQARAMAKAINDAADHLGRNGGRNGRHD
jgi:hypothetical protein